MNNRIVVRPYKKLGLDMHCVSIDGKVVKCYWSVEAASHYANRLKLYMKQNELNFVPEIPTSITVVSEIATLTSKEQT